MSKNASDFKYNYVTLCIFFRWIILLLIQSEKAGDFLVQKSTILLL
jgi:hypothetical protein